jgi:hypothetical protein
MSLNIVNLCLPLMGAEKVNSVQDDDWAKVINAIVPNMYSYLLEEHTWSWSINYRTLNKLSTNDNPRYKYAYVLPNNFLRVIKVYYANSEYPNYNTYENDYKISGSTLYSNKEYITIEYTISNYNLDSTPQSFKLALAYKILSEVSASLMNNPSLLQHYTQRAAIEIGNAISIDATNNGELMKFDYPKRYI